MVEKQFESQGFFFKSYEVLSEYEKGLIIDWRNQPEVRESLGLPPLGILELYDLVQNIQEQTHYYLVAKTYPLGSIMVEDDRDLENSCKIFLSREFLNQGYEEKIKESFFSSLRDRY